MTERFPAKETTYKIGHRNLPKLKEFTLELGESDVYVKMSNAVDMGNGRVLYEAILTDERGSRTIFIDREEILQSLKDLFLQEKRPEDEKRPQE